jgi:Zn-dependent peptidase ImmA (M78 family)/transcriptional regulator with XRE-family HTH domain
VFNPSRLALAKRRRRLTSKALAEAAGISPITISRIEHGENEPESATVEALSRVLGFPIAFFMGDDLDGPDRSCASFRSYSAMTAAERDAALAAGHFAYMLSDWVSERFNLPPADIIDGSQERRASGAALDASSAARALRQHWGLGEKPIPDMIRLLEAKGVRVFSLAENTRNVDAFSCWRDQVPYVFLNTLKSAERSRFDAAHELGHLVLHRHGGPDQGKAVELEAQSFASSFLMPEPDIRATIPRAITLDRLILQKRRWGVSASALAYRLNRLGILSAWHYRGMVIEMGRRGFRETEPNGIAREESIVWRKVLTELWADRVSKDQIAGQLGIPLDELENLIFGLVREPREAMPVNEPAKPRKRPDLRVVQ